MRIAYIAVALLSGCAISSPVMERVDGAYEISASASMARGGQVGARQYAWEQAQEFCKKEGKRAVLAGAEDQTITGQVGTYGQSGYANVSGPYAQGKSTAFGSSFPIVAGASSVTFLCR